MSEDRGHMTPFESTDELNECKRKEEEVAKRQIEHDYEEILDIIGFGRVQIKMVIICALVLLMVMNELMGIGIITIMSQCDFQLHESDKGIMHGVVLWGKILSSYFIGYLSDIFGRRKVLVYTNLAGITCSFATIFISNYTVFVTLRFFIGFFTGGAVGIVIAYAGEFCATAHRPTLLNFTNIANAVSFVYVPIVAWVILLMDWHFVVYEGFIFRPWRLLIFMNLLPGLIASLIMLKYPESPKFLLATGKQKEAYDALDWICGQNRKGCKLTDLQVYKVKGLNEGLIVEQNEKRRCIDAIDSFCMSTFALFKRPHVVNFVVASITMSGAFVISFGLAVWYPDIQNIIGTSGNQALSRPVCDIIVDRKRANVTNASCTDHVTNKSLIDFIIYGAISIVSYTILGFIINPQRRKGLLIFLLTTAGVCGIALIWLANPIGIVITFSLYIVLADLGVSTIVGYIVDLLPTKLNGQGSCLIMTSARICGAVSTYIIGLHLSSNCVIVFEIFAGMILVCAALAYFLKPLYERKGLDTVP